MLAASAIASPQTTTDFGTYGSWTVEAHTSADSDFCTMGEKIGWRVNMGLMVNADKPAVVNVVLLHPETGFGTLRPGDTFNLFSTINGNHQWWAEVTVSMDRNAAWFGMTAGDLKTLAGQINAGQVGSWEIDAPDIVPARSVPLDRFGAAVANLSRCLSAQGVKF